jgi:hypothetical protein
MQRNPNLALLEVTAVKLKPLLSELVFVGGCATGLLITDPGAGEIRKTFDVDVIAEISSYIEYTEFSERLRPLGFAEDSREGAPICRWQSDQIMLDVMPLDEKVLGFSNRWYRGALNAAEDRILSNGAVIRAITSPYFLGTKIEAFRGRGKNDYIGSHDLEDLIAVIDGRDSIVLEVEQAEPALRTFIATSIGSFLDAPMFIDFLPGSLMSDSASQSRITMLLSRLRQLASPFS